MYFTSFRANKHERDRDLGGRRDRTGVGDCSYRSHFALRHDVSTAEGTSREGAPASP